MKTVISACLIAATLAVVILPANADPGKHSSQEEHRRHHREQVLNN
ncbi:hypothetical protein ACQ4M4_14970 [Leptolyngbya sp. AN02str]|jgi:hypothetical protein|uniref:Uncharacterized protein n=1 Tax=Leptolyngbya sp. NK1-12 TaxID=2547451 RepID=A0AA96WLX3_9CYAN|nr:hypothetical protein [Leptolyngbya sp. NK1-12]WNZ28118.1 hypothetical protein HJG54_35035 [Leptolyngbya sp. NK1-12]